MIKCQLLLKYKNKYICSISDKEYDFIQVPNYFYAEDIASIWENVSIFISLLLSGNITDRYESIDKHTFFDWKKIFDFCNFSFVQPIGANAVLYDIDKFVEMNSPINLELFEQSLERLSDKLVSITLSELESIQKKWIEYKTKIGNQDIPDEPFGY